MNSVLHSSSAEIRSVTTWLEQVINDPNQPVVLFGVGWCGFCWSARDVLQQLGVPFRDIDVDNPEALGGHKVAEVRRALRERTGSHTVPQIFIGGGSIGGATELVSALRSGRLAEKLALIGMQLNEIG